MSEPCDCNWEWDHDEPEVSVYRCTICKRITEVGELGD